LGNRKEWIHKPSSRKRCRTFLSADLEFIG
jgi:hypothetical protein